MGHIVAIIKPTIKIDKLSDLAIIISLMMDDAAMTMFREQADSYQIELTLTDLQLSVELVDNVDWAVYNKVYTEEDIGKEIHRKLELRDLCESFKQVQHGDPDIQLQAQQNEQNRKYVFGEVVSNERGACYKIDKDGVVTVYTNISVTVNGKAGNNCLESVLRLNKVKSLSQAEILIKKQSLVKKEHEVSSKKQIQAINEHINTINGEVSSQKASIDSLKQELKASRQQILALQAADKFNKEVITQLKIQLIKAQNQRQRLVSRVDELTNQDKVRYDFIVRQQPYFPMFRLQPSSQKITYTGNDQFTTQALFNFTVPFDSVFTFFIKIIKTKNRLIYVGITDKTKQLASRYSYISKNAVCYKASNGSKFPNCEQEGDGFAQGELLQVLVNLKNKEIAWRVDGKLRAAHNHEILADKARMFLPYVEMEDVGDCVEWLGCRIYEN